MITWTVHLRARDGQAGNWIELANELTETSNRLDPGCVVYLCLQHRDDPLEFTWYEQWADMDTLNTHVERINPIVRGRREDGRRVPTLSDTIERRVQKAWHECQDADPAPRDWKSPGYSGLVYYTVHRGREAEFAALLPQLTRHAQSAQGNVTAIFHQSEDEPARFMLFEQWARAEDREAARRGLSEHDGEARPGGDIPPDISGLAANVERIACTVVA